MSNVSETIVNPNYAFEDFYLEVNLLSVPQSKMLPIG